MFQVLLRKGAFNDICSCADPARITVNIHVHTVDAKVNKILLKSLSAACSNVKEIES